MIRNLTDYKNEIGHYHFGDNPGRREPGTGELNYKNIFKAIADTGYTGCVSAEFSKSKDLSVRTCCASSLTALRSKGEGEGRGRGQSWGEGEGRGRWGEGEGFFGLHAARLLLTSTSVHVHSPLMSTSVQVHRLRPLTSTKVLPSAVIPCPLCHHVHHVHHVTITMSTMYLCPHLFAP